jgi:hypothetical protein
LEMLPSRKLELDLSLSSPLFNGISGTLMF